MLGRGYVLEHCSNYLRQKNESKKLAIYVTDVLKVIADNTARNGHGGFTIKSRYVDLLDEGKPLNKPKEDANTIINRMKQRLSAMKEGEDELTQSDCKTDS